VENLLFSKIFFYCTDDANSNFIDSFADKLQKMKSILNNESEINTIQTLNDSEIISVDQNAKKIEDRPPVLLQRTELLNAIENQSVEIFAKIDAKPPPNGYFFKFVKSVFLIFHFLLFLF
jgi:hypothetical protein